MLMVMFLAGMLLGCLLVALVFQKTDLAKVLSLGFGIYLAAYCFVTGMLFLFHCFRVDTAALVTMLLLMLLSAAVYFVRGCKGFSLRYHWKSYIPPAIILALAALVSGGQISGYYGTGQDQGIYQIRAMYYYADRDPEQIDFDEYQEVVEEGSKYEAMTYVSEIEDLMGYYTDEELFEEEGRISGVLHGLGVLPALMALWGRLFGLRYMNHVMQFCYLLSIVNVWLICRNLKEDKDFYLHPAALLFALSPIVLWCGRNTLTEMLLTLFVSSWFVVLTGTMKNKVQWLAGFPIAGICVVHILSTVLIPLVVLLYWHAYLVDGRRVFLATLMISLVEYGLGYTMMKESFTYYTDYNYTRIFRLTGDLINEKNMLFVVWGAVAVCLLICLYYLLRGERSLLYGWVGRMQASERGPLVGKIVAGIALGLMLLLLLLEVFKRISSPEAIPRLTIFGYLLMTGFVLLPLAMVSLVKGGGKLFTDRKSFALGFTFLYVLLLYCKVLWPEVDYYYYFARYLAPFIFVPVVMAGQLLKKVPKVVTGVAAVALSGLMLLLNPILFKGQDLSYCKYRLIEDITSCIGENDAVLINEQGYHCQRVFAFPIKALCGADIYFVRGSELNRQMERLDEEYDTVYLLSLDTGKLVGEHEGWRLLYKGRAQGGSYEQRKEEGVLPFPEKWTAVNTPVVLMTKEIKE